MLEILPDLTKEYILNQLTQEEIFEKFLGIQVEFGVLVKSPFRTDNNPTCSWYYTHNNTLNFRDFRPGEFWGDCFDAAAATMIPRRNANYKKDFIEILEYIAKAFKIHRYADSIDIELQKIKTITPVISKYKESPHIQIEKRNWNLDDLQYWRKLGKNIQSDLLTYLDIYPINKIYVNGTLIYRYKYTDAAYGYYNGVKNNKEFWKIYFRNRVKKDRFFTNHSLPYGFKQLFPAPVNIISKSRKDFVTLYSLNYSNFHVAAEGIIAEAKQVNYLKNLSPFVCTFFDYDLAGLKATQKYKRKYRTVPLFLTDNKWNIKNNIVGYNGQKDVSDYIFTFGVQKTDDLMKYMLDDLYEAAYKLSTLTHNNIMYD
jgi:hypothetical protein